MDIKAIFAIIRYALKELMLRRIPATILFIAIAFTVFLVGVNLPQNFTSTALVQAERKNILEPLLRGRAEATEITPVSIVLETLYSERLLSRVAIRLELTNAESTPEEVTAARRKIAREMYHEIKDDNVLRLFYTSSSPEQSHENLSAVVSVFREDANKQQRDESEEAYQFISEQVDKYREQLTEAERRLSDYKLNNMDGTEAESLERVLQLRAEIEQIELTVEENQAKAVSLREQIKVEGELQQARMQLTTLQNQRLTLESNLQNLQLAFQDDYPDIISTKNQLEIVNQEIEDVRSQNPNLPSEVSNDEVSLFEGLRTALSNNELETESLNRRKQSLTRILERENDRADSLTVHQAKLAELTRDYDKTKQIYEELLQRRENASLSVTIDEAGQGMSYKFREMPTMPTSAEGPPPAIFIAVAPVLGIITLFGLSFAYVFLDPRIRYGVVSKAKIPEGIDIIVNIPSYKKEPIISLSSKTNWILFAVLVIAAGLYGYIAMEWLAAN
ncbi:hypothetical protein [Sessilibacter corallicola]|uniref:Wzz/FepE/Etk N-terminal domain-containing protein n=1 Tax=Sessilibacter corallicola TaxID=2904075 RepID=A0ABQ0AAT4_9GAMM|nr:hypothetical protein [Sessilibacter corallicola]MCE2028155.1 hypothetical protein [Sessilibacter corallicola]